MDNQRATYDDLGIEYGEVFEGQTYPQKVRTISGLIVETETERGAASERKLFRSVRLFTSHFPSPISPRDPARLAHDQIARVGSLREGAS